MTLELDITATDLVFTVTGTPAPPEQGIIVSEAARCGNTERPLTRSSDSTREGLAMQATRGFDSLPVHIQRNIVRDPSGCWLWTRSRSADGYGWASLANKTHQAHRLVYRLLVGDPPEGTHLDHLCRVRHCVNPRHLQPVTPRENLTRSPIAPAGQRACLKCGSSFVMIGRTNPQRRCPKCSDEYNRQQRRIRTARERAARQVAR